MSPDRGDHMVDVVTGETCVFFETMGPSYAPLYVQGRFWFLDGSQRIRRMRRMRLAMDGEARAFERDRIRSLTV